MHYRRLGSSELKVSDIALGSWLTIAGGLEQARVEAVTEAAFDAGINFFDTANVYGLGAAETVWGEILNRRPRDSFVLATKVYARMSDDDDGLAPAQIEKQLDASLRRLQVDYIDLYQAHRFDAAVPIEDTLEAFQRAVDIGKVRYLGFSEWTPEQIQTAVDIAGPDLFVSSQPQYSMLWQAPEAEVFPLCERYDISQLVWSPLAQGLLSGKYRPREPAPSGSRFADAKMRGARDLIYTDKGAEAAARLIPVADDLGITPAQLALAWVLRRREVAAAIIGASLPEQIFENAAASGLELDTETLERIDEALGDAPVIGQRIAARANPGIMRRSTAS